MSSRQKLIGVGVNASKGSFSELHDAIDWEHFPGNRFLVLSEFIQMINDTDLFQARNWQTLYR